MNVFGLIQRGLAAMLIAGVTLAPSRVPAAEWTLVGSVGPEIRLFVDDPEFAGQDDRHFSPSIVAEPELTVRWNNDADRITVTPFARYDANDSRRSHFDLREANWLHTGHGWDLLAGLGKVFWGVSESRHLVDIINQTDAVEDIDQEDKLGQPMIALTLERGWGALRLFVLPGFRERTFPADDARLHGPTLINQDSTYDSGAKNRHVDFAVRWSHAIGDLDVGLAHFHGTSREPRLLTVLRSDMALISTPHYDQIDQTSVDAQLTDGATLWKLEAMTRSGHGKRFAAAVAGLEHTIFDFWKSGADLGLLAEYLYDGRENQDETKAPETALENDVFIGLRLTLNDEQNSAMLLGAVVDRVNQSTLISIEAERRIGDNWRGEINARLFRNVTNRDGLARIGNDGFVALRLSRFF
jgi:hypothetical protein